MLIKEMSNSIIGVLPELRVFADSLQSDSQSWTAAQAVENLQTLRSVPIAMEAV
jgi:hypothetical protein